MAIDIREIQLSDQQKRRVAELAEQTGKPWTEIVDERLSSLDTAPDNGVPDDRDDSYIEDYDKWLANFQRWMSQRRSYNPNFDDSRESIYPDRW